MVINNDTTSISFYPFCDFTSTTTAVIEVWHKQTKTMVSAIGAVTKTGSQISMAMPDMSTLPAVNLDTILIRIFDANVLMWEYLATWSDENTNINNRFKTWDSTAPTSPQWIKL
jgi:hypothetical protein